MSGFISFRHKWEKSICYAIFLNLGLSKGGQMIDKNIISKDVSENDKEKMQFILNENRELIEIEREKCLPVEYPINYKLKNAFEVFIRVEDTENYWISNYGRTVNNLNHKGKKTFYAHKEGKCHLTIYEIDKRDDS